MARKPTGKTYIWRNGKKEEFHCPEPARLSKFGEWMKAHPNGIGRVLDWKAVMR